MESSTFREHVQYLARRKLGAVEEAQKLVQEVLGDNQPLLKHSLGTALLLAELGLDGATITAALLHHLPQEEKLTVPLLKERFGDEVARLVEGVGRLAALPAPRESASPELQAENLRKMLLALAEDIRVVFIRLAEQMESLGRLEGLPPESARQMAAETLEVYAPLAHWMGIARFFQEMEDRAFACLEPEEYRSLEGKVQEQLRRWQDTLIAAREELGRELAAAGIPADITSRTKHLYSLHQKLDRYAAQGKGFGDIHDLIALRVVVESLAECYSALGIIHSQWHPLPGEFNDYIANPKENGYRSVHTTVVFQGVPVEVQLRTREMHQIAEYGLAAHPRYKGGGRVSLPADWMARVRRFLDKHRELQGEEFLESLRTDVFQDRVFVYTPKGEIVELPRGATPLDFAYRIHTDLGHRCLGARVNEKMVPLSYPLSNGDRVEILSSRAAKAPSRDWLNPALGYLKTVHAREKARQWFRRQERQENIDRGREMVERELRRLGMGLGNYEELATSLGYGTVEEFFATVGTGTITPHQVVQKLVAPPPPPPAVVAPRPTPIPARIRVQGVTNLLTKLAGCCHPLPGEPVMGYITRSRGISIHRANCPNILHEPEKERLVPVEWGREEVFYPAVVEIRAWDRVGLLRDISALVAEEGVNIQEIKAQEREDRTGYFRLTLQTRDLSQLSRILSRLEEIKGVISARRG